MDSLNTRKRPVRGAYLDIYQDLVALLEISSSIYDRSVQSFDKEYEEALEIRERDRRLSEDRFESLKQRRSLPQSRL
jgi:hypothetical protein